jgi:uncharacterized protein (DUF983 family)
VGLWERLHPEDKHKPAASPTIAEGLNTAQEVRREVWGIPGRCPQCNGRAYLDRIDVVERMMFEHCTECGHEWNVSEAETAGSSPS